MTKRKLDVCLLSSLSLRGTAQFEAVPRARGASATTNTYIAHPESEILDQGREEGWDFLRSFLKMLSNEKELRH